MARIVEGLGEIADRYGTLYCDLWGCLHDGIRALPEAVAACRDFRGRGGRVVLLTNAPRPRADVADQIRGMGVPDDAWDAIATSGDGARVALFEGQVGRRIRFIGEPKDQPFLVPPKIVADPVAIELVGIGAADGIACTGPEDAHADPELYRAEFEDAVARDLPFLCANPDIQVDRGESREWCAGAVARVYEAMGGRVLYFGKPHAPAYALARRRLIEAGGDPDAPVLAVGDGILTDVAGAVAAGIDALFVTGGLARADTATDRHPDPDLLEAYLARHGADPAYAIGALRP